MDACFLLGFGFTKILYILSLSFFYCESYILKPFVDDFPLTAYYFRKDDHSLSVVGHSDIESDYNVLYTVRNYGRFKF